MHTNCKGLEYESSRNMYQPQGLPNILTDIAILSLPVRVVWGLKATLVHRLTVIAVFFCWVVCTFSNFPEALPTSSSAVNTNKPSQQRDIHQRPPILHPFPIPAHRYILDLSQSLHLESDRNFKRDHLRLHADTAPVVRDALIQIRESRWHLENTNNRWQSIRSPKFRSRRNGFEARKRALIQDESAAACWPG